MFRSRSGHGWCYRSATHVIEETVTETIQVYFWWGVQLHMRASYALRDETI